MNLFLFLNKYGSSPFYFDFIIKINKNDYKFKIYKNCSILSDNNIEIKEPRIFNFQKLLFKYNEVNLSSPLPIKVNKKIKHQLITIYIPKNKNNVTIFNRLVRRKLLLKDTRFKEKSVFDIYNSYI
jgi:hypothetical protein